MDEKPVVSYKIEPEEAGQRLDVFFAARLGVSRSRAQKLISTATLAGASIKASYVTREGDEIHLEGAAEAASDTPAEALAQPFIAGDVAVPPIFFEDDYLIVLNKPRDLAVHPGAGERQTTLVDVLRASGRSLSAVGPPERAGIVHRLDKDTSGVMVVCKTDVAHWKLAEDFAARRVTKTYTALVCGVPTLRGRIEAPIARHPVQRKKMAIVPAGRPAVTEYETVHTWPKFAQLKINLLTGRTHQIRVHLAYVQHPVVGDAVYGGVQRALSSVPNEAARQAIEALQGQALHSTRLAFTHPITGTALEFETALPEDMQRIIEVL
ncbi:MAG: RluA family pseudouridine synthase [Abitibacteriaceae bacterium]|nr:RluA family pseudouridine synthase [Abditibacteriaceae bacterium]